MVPGVWVPLYSLNKTIDKTCMAIQINNFIRSKYKQNFMGKTLVYGGYDWVLV